MAGKHGGARKGSGRKPALAVVLKRESLESRNASAEYALLLFDTVMRDERQEIALRLGAAREVMDRVWGKPKQALAVFDWRAEAERQGVDPQLFFERAVNHILSDMDTKAGGEVIEHAAQEASDMVDNMHE